MTLYIIVVCLRIYSPCISRCKTIMLSDILLCYVEWLCVNSFSLQKFTCVDEECHSCNQWTSHFETSRHISFRPSQIVLRGTKYHIQCDFM
jgi:hypothetical protein